MRYYLLLLIPLIFFSCEEEQQDATKDELLQQMEALSQSIDGLISISCADSGECKAAGIGAKACGGPTHYVVYSSDTNETALFLLIDEYTGINKRYNLLTEAVSDCSISTIPEPECISGNCQIVD